MSKLLFRDGMDEESDGKVTICSWMEAHFGSEAVMVSVAGVAYDAHSVVCLLICYLHDLRRKSLRKSSKAMTDRLRQHRHPALGQLPHPQASACLGGHRK